MNLTLLMVGLAITVLVSAQARLWWQRRKHIYFANISEGIHEGGLISYTPDASITTRFLLVKRGTAADKVAICGAADVPIGVALDEFDLTNAPEIPIAVHLLGGSALNTVRMIASAAISQDALLEPAANGKVATLGGGAGTHHVVGRAITAAAADGDIIEVVPMYFLRVI